ncbi:hypothetical protein KGY79_08360 [Candidatus Bipolaricaulota bacterium]|nr:hypothetical protein [Candidatus Bipolaricaulota bacterium]
MFDNKKSLLVGVLALSLVFGLSFVSLAETSPKLPPNYSSADGSSSKPYEITSLANLRWLSQHSGEWDKHYIQTTDINASETSSWNGGDGFSPIGNDPEDGGTAFTGSYDGQRYEIISLYIDRGSQYNVGFFGYTGGEAEINNLGVVNADVTGDYRVGGLVGYNVGDTVSNSYATGSVNGSKFVGGLVGLNEDVKVSSSYANGDVTGDGSNVGGLVGDNNGGKLSNSYATGSVNGSSGVGGLVGRNRGTVNNSYATGGVQGEDHVGGLAGINAYYGSESGEVNNSYATGEVSGSGDNVGGLVGTNWGNGIVENSYATGSVSGDNNVGGLVGSNDDTVKNSFWNTETSGQEESDGGTGLTTSEMQREYTFTDVGWDFMEETTVGSDDYWGINPNENSGYPFLAWQGHDHYAEEPSETAPYEISKLEELYWITQDDSRWTYKYKQTSNIYASATSSWNGDHGFLPIGNGTTEFTGTYDGKEYEIKNLHIVRGNKDIVGLFGHTGSGAEIKNLGVVNADVTGENLVGGLVGVNEGSVTSSHGGGEVKSALDGVGSLVGWNKGVVLDSWSTGRVNGNDLVGGLVGFNGPLPEGSVQSTASSNGFLYDLDAGTVEANSNALVNRSYTMTNVDGTGGFLGGLLGYNGGTTSNCYATGNVIRTEDQDYTEYSGSYGGFAGLNEGKIEYSYSTGEVKYNFEGADDPTDKGFVGAEGGEYTEYTSNFFDSEASNQNTDAVGAAIGKTTSQMQNISTFKNAGWEVQAVGADEDDYPYLAWEEGENSTWLQEQEPPSVSFTYTPSEPNVEEEVAFDASGSSDPDSSIDEYKWDWDGDGTFDETISSPTTSHSYSQGGAYRVELKIVDEYDVTDSTTEEIKIGSVSPEALINHGPNPVPSEGCIFWLDLPDDASGATLKVYDVDGRPLAEADIGSGQGRHPTTGRWQPRDANGHKLGSGFYMYKLKVEHTDGSVTWSDIQKMVVDRSK